MLFEMMKALPKPMRRRVSWPGVLGVVMCAFYGGAAAAQTAGDGPPLPKVTAPDGAGVDFMTGRRVGTDSAISIGAADAPALQFTEGAGGFDGTPFAGFHYTDGTYPNFADMWVLGSRVASNKFPDGTKRTLPDGMISTGTGLLIEGDGTRWNFAATGNNTTNNQGIPDSYVTTIVHPDGETLTYNYSAVPVQGTTRNILHSITSNAGYQLNIQWTASFVAPAYLNVQKITLTNRRYAYCDPQGSGCTGSYAWPSITWSSDAAGNVTAATSGLRSIVYGAKQQQTSGSPPLWTQQITSGSGVVRTYTGHVNATPGAFYLGRPASIVNPCIDGMAIWQVQGASGTWNYNYATTCPPQQGPLVIQTLTRTDPLGNSQSRSGGTFTDELGRQSSYTYIDQWGQTTVADGGTAISKVTSFTAPEGNKITWDYGAGYGPQNLVTTTVTPKPGSSDPTLIWSSGYPTGCNASTNINCNKPSYQIDPKGNRTDYTYDPVHGGILTKTLPPDANGVRPQIRYGYQQLSAKVLNASGQLVNETPIWKLVSTSTCRTLTSCAGTADEVVTSYTYDDNLLVASVTTRAGDNSVSSTTSNTYDPVGNLVSVDGPLPGSGDTTRYVYDSLRRLVATMGPDPDGAGPLPVPVVRTTYDGDGRPTLVETGHAVDQSDAALASMTVDRAVSTSYDAAGRKISDKVIAGGSIFGVTQYGYDGLDRVVCTAVRMNSAVFGQLPASACDLGAPGTLGPDRITHNIYDPAGQLLKVQKAYGITTANFYPATLQQDYATFEYTPNGKQKAVIDANGNRAEMLFDGLDRQIRWTFPSPATAGSANPADYESYVYDPNGNPTSFRKRDGVTLTYQYDALDRLTLKSVPASATGAAGYSVFYGYDLRGLQTYARFGSSTGPGVTNVYDGLARLTASTTTMDGVSRTMNSTYDAAGNRVQLSGDAGYNASFAYDSLSRMTAYVSVVQVGYDAGGRRSSLTMGPGTTTSSVAYGYDPVGRLATLGHDLAGTSADQTLTFGYNPASQMVSRTSSNDAYASNTAYNVSRAYSVNGLNQYTAAGTAAFTYDANGNLTSDGSNTYVYDAENRLVSRSGGVSLAYDPLGRLWQVSAPSGTRRSIYDGSRLLQEYDAAGNPVSAYVYGPGEDEPLSWYSAAGRRHLHADHQGSITAIADDNGNAVAVNAYDPWGIPNAANIGRFGYTGQAWVPELGMWYYKARIYSPTLGRFLQSDPVGYDDQMNLYAYAGNDPVNRADPYGLNQRCVGDPPPEPSKQASEPPHAECRDDGKKPDATDEIVITGVRKKKKVPLKGEEMFTSVVGTELRVFPAEHSWDCGGFIANSASAALFGGGVPGHTHPSGSDDNSLNTDPSLGPDDGLAANNPTHRAYKISPVGIVRIERAGNGTYSATLVSGKWGQSKQSVMATLTSFNQHAGSTVAGGATAQGIAKKTCTQRW